jgi:hypothetical protein
MSYARDNRQVLRGCLLVLLALALLLLIPYALLTRGFSVPIQCVFGQETALRASFEVAVRDDEIEALEAALKGIADRRGMAFGSMPLPAFPSGRRSVAFDLCDREAQLVASRGEDTDTVSIFISQAASAPPDKATALAEDVRIWLAERRSAERPRSTQNGHSSSIAFGILLVPSEDAIHEVGRA